MWHDSVKDTRQQKERWGWGLAARGGGGGLAVGQNLKKGVGNIAGLCIKWVS